MRETGVVVVLALLIVAAVWLIASGLRQERPGLAESLRRLRRPAETGGRVDAAAASPTVSTTGATGTTGTAVRWHDRVAARIGAQVGAALRRWAPATSSDRAADRLTDRWVTPLRVIGRSVETHLGLLTLGALAGLVVPSLIVALLQVAGVVSISFWVPAAVSLGLAAVVPMLMHSDAVSRAAAIRVDLRHQLGAYLDMVTMLLAGNSGYEGALDQAARAGDGLLFRELRRRMREVAAGGRSLVDALALVADDLGLVELEQVAATATLSAAEGAPVARSLSAKCTTLRSTLASDEEAAARIRNDKVTPPLVGMALLFMALIIYPALNLN